MISKFYTVYLLPFKRKTRSAFFSFPSWYFTIVQNNVEWLFSVSATDMITKKKKRAHRERQDSSLQMHLLSET